MLGVQELGYSIMSTGGTGKHLKANGIECEIVLKIQEGRPNIGDMVKNGEIAMMLITSTGLLTSPSSSFKHTVHQCVSASTCLWSRVAVLVIPHMWAVARVTQRLTVQQCSLFYYIKHSFVVMSCLLGIRCSIVKHAAQVAFAVKLDQGAGLSYLA